MTQMFNSFRSNLVFAALLGGAITFAALPAAAGPGEKGHSHDHQHSDKPGAHGDHAMKGGMPGDPSKVSRTVVVIAKDTEFNLKKIQVKAGETIRFVIKNKGELVHEFTIGAPEMQIAHQAEMLKMMEEGHFTADKIMQGMNHSHGNSAMMEPGKNSEVIWMFHEGATLEFGCNIPGHYEQGMKGEFVIGGI